MVDLAQFEKLCFIMKQYNVTSYKTSDLEVNMARRLDLGAYVNEQERQPTDDELLENPYVGLEG